MLTTILNSTFGKKKPATSFKVANPLSTLSLFLHPSKLLHCNLLAQKFLCFFALNAVEKRFLEKMPRTRTTGGIGF